MIYADGAGSGAAVVDLLDSLTFGGTKLTATASELNLMDGGTSALELQQLPQVMAS